MFESGHAGDFGELKIGLGKKPAHTVQPDAENLRIRRSSDDAREAPFEHTSGERDCPQQGRDVKAIASAFPDEFQGGCDVPVLDREHIRGLPGHHAQGLDQMGQGFGAFACHQPGQQGGGLETDPLGVQDHARQGKVRQFAEDLVLVHADDGHLVRYGHIHLAAAVQDLPSADIVACHDAAGFRQILEPGHQIQLKALAVILVTVCLAGSKRPAVFERLAGKSRLRNPFGEADPAHVRPIGAIEPAEREIPEPALQQVLRREASHKPFVGADLRERQTGQAPAQVHHRHSGFRQHPRHLRGRYPCDDSIPFPSAEPLREMLARIAFLELDGPRAVDPDILGDSHQQFPPIAAR